MNDEPSVLALLNGRIDEVVKRLDDHITDCSAKSTRLFWAVLSVLGYMVAHDYLPRVLH